MACLVCKPKSAHSNPLARRFRAAARRRSYPILLGDGADFWHESSHSICGGWHCDEPALYGISAIRDQNLVAVDLDDPAFSVEATRSSAATLPNAGARCLKSNRSGGSLFCHGFGQGSISAIGHGMPFVGLFMLVGAVRYCACVLKPGLGLAVFLADQQNADH